MHRLLMALVVIGPISLVPSTAAAATFPSRCDDPTHGFSVGVPAGWWVHPADTPRGIGECEYFGQSPFELRPDEDGLLVGHAIAMRWIEGCVGFVQPPKSNEAVEVAGRPARRIVVVPNEGPGSPDHASTFYWIQLSEEDCAEDSRYLAVSTSDTAAHYPRNVAVLDQMVHTIALAVPDAAMPGPRQPDRTTVFGEMLLAVAVLWASLRYSQPRLRK